jgi:endonuclease/exonuclease/phosphatase family metal-dependent hydrolase
MFGKSKNLSVLTFNTLGTTFFAPDILKRDNKIAEIINNTGYDVVCLQEIFTYIQLFIFKRKLKKYPYCFYVKNPLGPRGGLVIFSKHSLSQKSISSYSQPKNAFVPFYVNLAQPSILSAIIDPFEIRIVTTHLSSDNEHNLTPKNKLYKLIKSQSEEAAEVVNHYTKNNESVIVAGDFNIAKNSELYNNFLKKTKLTDIYAKEEQPTYDPDRVDFFYRSPADRCDFIFTSSNNKKMIPTLLSYALTEQLTLPNGKKSYLSDHIGLYCTFRVNILI